MKLQRRLIAIGLFALAMAYIEAAAVTYLRGMYGIQDLLQDLPVVPDRFWWIEVGRELATLMMLATVGWIAGQRWQDRAGYALLAWGLWDIAYYAWLFIFIGWPKMLVDWDLLFLIPIPWWGPVLAPILASLVLVIGGVAIVVKTERGELVRMTKRESGLAIASSLLAFYVLIFDAQRALPDGLDAVIRARPTEFNWPLYLAALGGMAFSIWRAVRSSTDVR